MGLLGNNTAAFETEDETATLPDAATASNAAQATSAPAAAPEAAAATATPAAAPAVPEPAAAAAVTKVVNAAVATLPKTDAVPVQRHALAVKVAEKGKMLVSFKDALRVDYNTLDQIIANNGNFMERETKKIMGDTVIFRLMSYQDSWVIGCNDDKAPKEFVAFSEDGIVCTDGVLVTDKVKEFVDAGWAKASSKKRVVVVGAVESAAKTGDFNGMLMQFDMSPVSKTMWDRYLAQTAYKLSIAGDLDIDQATRIKATTRLDTKNGNTFTVAVFSVAD